MPGRNLQTDENGRVKRGPGRPKGSQNKVGSAAKDMIAQAALDLGGIDRLVQWAQESPENEKAFWSTIFTKLVPVQVAAAIKMDITKVELVSLK